MIRASFPASGSPQVLQELAGFRFFEPLPASCSTFVHYLPGAANTLPSCFSFSRLAFTYGWLTGLPFELTVVGLAWVKTVWFVLENSRQVIRATAQNLPYHRLLALMGVNMSQISLSFVLDVYCLQRPPAGQSGQFRQP